MDKLIQNAVVERVKDAIVDYVKRSSGPVRPTELARWLGIEPKIVRRLCEELIREGSLGTKPKEGE